MGIKKVSVELDCKRKSGGSNSFRVEVDCDDKYLSGDVLKIKALLLKIVERERPDIFVEFETVRVSAYSKR